MGDFDGLFSLDTVGEAFKGSPGPSPVKDEPDPDPEAEVLECNLNVKSSANPDTFTVEEPFTTLKVPLVEPNFSDRITGDKNSATSLSSCRLLLSSLRNFLFECIQKEDFCTSIKLARCETGVSQPASPSDPNVHASPTASGADGISDLSESDSLISMGSQGSDVCKDLKVEVSDSTSSDVIVMELSQNILSRIVKEMEQARHSSSSQPFPRCSRITGNGMGGRQGANRRYYTGGEALGEGDIRESNPHIYFLSHLYRRRRTICYYCGFSKCSRSVNSTNRCDFRCCTKCGYIHKWGSAACRGDPHRAQTLVASNNWTMRRHNPWKHQNENIQKLLRCFYCGAYGEANFKCQGMSCPQGAKSLEYRRLEFIEPGLLKKIAKKNHWQYPHLKNPAYEFN